MRKAIIIQARLGSTRLPNKVLKLIDNKPLIDHILDQLSFFKQGFKIIVATTTNPRDDILYNHLINKDVLVFRGDEQNVLKRFVDAATYFNVDLIVRVCADNLFINSKYINVLSNKLESDNLDYVSLQFSDKTPAILTGTGFVVEVTTLNALKKILQLTDKNKYLEHVTNYLYLHPNLFKIHFETIEKNLDFKNIRLTIDTIEDFNRVENIFRNARTYDLTKILMTITTNKHLLNEMFLENKKNKK